MEKSDKLGGETRKEIVNLGVEMIKTKLRESHAGVREMSYAEKKSDVFKISRQDVDGILDTILLLKDILDEKTGQVEALVVDLESYSWFDGLDEEDLQLLNDLIASSRDLHGTLIRQYVILDGVKKKGIAREELRAFKLALDELKEACEDLESVFFGLPAIPEFVETTRILSLVG